MLNPDTIRFLDMYAGIPLCLLLTIHRAFCRLVKKENQTSRRHSRLLFIKLLEQGSTVLAYSAFNRAVEYAGRENVYVLVFKENRQILDILGVIPKQNIFEIDARNLVSFLTSLIKALFRIRRQHIDACVDMEFFSRASAIISYLSGAGKRVGLHALYGEKPYRGDLFTHRLKYNPCLHTKTFFLSLVEALESVPPAHSAPIVMKTPGDPDGIPHFVPSEEEKRVVSDKIASLAHRPLVHPVVILNPNTSDLVPIRRWPEENFVKLGKMIIAEFPNSSILVTGTLTEKERAFAIANKIQGAVSLAGLTDLRGLLTVYCIADMLVTNDSGPAHFAALTPIRSIVLFGPETPILYSPVAANCEVIYQNLACSPCIDVHNYKKSSCSLAECMKSITPEEIFERVKKGSTKCG